MIVAGTGHRPNKLGGYGTEARNRLVNLATDVLRKRQPQRVISGMALGWDQALAVAACALDLPWTAAVPFEGQERAWPESSQREYRELLSLADDVVVVSPGGYASWKMQRRNQWMVDHADLVLALWDGSPGGTGNCVDYVRRTNKPLLNYWTLFEALPG